MTFLSSAFCYSSIRASINPSDKDKLYQLKDENLLNLQDDDLERFIDILEANGIEEAKEDFDYKILKQDEIPYNTVFHVIKND